MNEQRRKIPRSIQVSLDGATGNAIYDYMETEGLPSPSETIRTLVQIALASDSSDGKIRAALRRGCNETRIRSINALMAWWNSYFKEMNKELAQIEYDSQLCPKCGERCAHCVAKAREMSAKVLADEASKTAASTAAIDATIAEANK